MKNVSKVPVASNTGILPLSRTWHVCSMKNFNPHFKDWAMNHTAFTHWCARHLPIVPLRRSILSRVHEHRWYRPAWRREAAHDWNIPLVTGSHIVCPHGSCADASGGACLERWCLFHRHYTCSRACISCAPCSFGALDSTPRLHTQLRLRAGFVQNLAFPDCQLGMPCWVHLISETLPGW